MNNKLKDNFTADQLQSLKEGILERIIELDNEIANCKDIDTMLSHLDLEYQQYVRLIQLCDNMQEIEAYKEILNNIKKKFHALYDVVIQNCNYSIWDAFNYGEDKLKCDTEEDSEIYEIKCDNTNNDENTIEWTITNSNEAILNTNDNRVKECIIDNYKKDYISEEDFNNLFDYKQSYEDKQSYKENQDNENDYNYVNSPDHYNTYDVEVIDMMERIWGTEAVIMWAKLTAWKYRQRMGTKPNEPVERDIEKEQWYLNKANELKEKLVKEGRK